MEFRGKTDSSSSSAQHHQQQQQQYQPPTQSHASQRHRRRTTSANNSLENKKNAKNEAVSKDQYPLLAGSTKDEAVVVAVTSGTGTTVSPDPSQGVTRSGISSRQSLGETPTSSRADDCDVDSHADGEDYFDAESGLSSPDPPVKPQVTIYVEKSIDGDEPVLAFQKELSCPGDDAAKGKISDSNINEIPSSIPMHKRQSKQNVPSNSNGDKKVNKLCRSNAFQDEDASPEPPLSPPADLDVAVSVETVETVTKNMSRLTASGRAGLMNQRSSGSNDSTSPALSRDSSTEYTDSTGIDLQQFFTVTLKQAKSRHFLMQTERDVLNFVLDPKKTVYKFPPLPSYQRMLIHRVAAFFGLDHNIEKKSECIIVNKTPNTRIPDFKFESIPFPSPSASVSKLGSSESVARNGAAGTESFSDDNSLIEPKKLLLRKEDEKSHSLDKSPDGRSMINNSNSNNGQTDKSLRSKSYEERQVEYEQARTRIFNSQASSSSEGGAEPGSLCNTANSSGIDVSCAGIIPGNLPMTANSSLRSSQEEDLMRVSSTDKPWSSVESEGSGRLQRQNRTERSLDLEGHRRSHLLYPDYKSNSTEGSVSYRSRGGGHSFPRSKGVPKASSFGGTETSSGQSSNYRMTKTNSTPVNQMAASAESNPSLKKESMEGMREGPSSSGGPPLLPKPNLMHQSSAPVNTGRAASSLPSRQSWHQNQRWQSQQHQTGHHFHPHHFSGGRQRHPRPGSHSHPSHSSPSHQFHPGMFVPPTAFLPPPPPVLPPPGSFWPNPESCMRPLNSVQFYFASPANANVKDMSTDQQQMILQPGPLLPNDPQMYPGMYLVPVTPQVSSVVPPQASSQPPPPGPSPTFSSNPKEPTRNSSSGSSSGSYSGRQSQPLQNQPQQHQQPMMSVQMPPPPAMYYMNPGQGPPAPQMMFVASPARNLSSSPFVPQSMQTIPPHVTFLAPSPTGPGAPGGPSPGLLPLPPYPYPSVSPHFAFPGGQLSLDISEQESQQQQSSMQSASSMTDQSFSPYMTSATSPAAYFVPPGQTSGPPPTQAASFAAPKGSSPDSASSPTPPNTMSTHYLSGYPILSPASHQMLMTGQFCPIGTNSSSQSGHQSMQQTSHHHHRGHSRGRGSGGNFRNNNQT